MANISGIEFSEEIMIHKIMCVRCRQRLTAAPNETTVRCGACSTVNEIVKPTKWSAQSKRKINFMGGIASMFGNKKRKEMSPDSQRVTKKRAVLIGVSYFDQKRFKLQGTTNDVKYMKSLLIDHFGYQEHNIRILTEEKKEPELVPKKKNIQESMKWLVEDCEAGDSLVFYFSGHGIRQPDFDCDESDGFYENICPVDFMEEGMILDDEIYAAIVAPLAKGVTLHAIVDACHSGTIIDLQYVYDMEENIWKENNKKRMINANGGLAISITACRDEQLAAETNAFADENMMSGAMTYVLQDSVKKDKKITYGDLLESINKFIADANREGCLPNRLIRKVLKRHWFLQKPQLSASERFNVYERHFRL